MVLTPKMVGICTLLSDSGGRCSGAVDVVPGSGRLPGVPRGRFLGRKLDLCAGTTGDECLKFKELNII